MDEILNEYSLLLSRVDDWFSTCSEAFPLEINCASGCSGCCRGLFDITLLDAALLRRGFDSLDAGVRERVRTLAQDRVTALGEKWPDFAPPYVLNLRPEEEWEELMPEDDDAPCPLLDAAGRCLVYEHRPMTCRLHGIPLVEPSGEVFFEEGCSLNFPHSDPLALESIRYQFQELFRGELAIFKVFSEELLEHRLNELDTLIPAALLVDYRSFPWRSWGVDNIPRLISNPPA